MRRSLLLALILLAVPACEPSSSPPPPATTTAPSDRPSILVDVNSASVAELAALPEIGKAYAARIIEGRPYANKQQLRSRGILPDRVYERVAPMLVARKR
jgi:competence protein ComEA